MLMYRYSDKTGNVFTLLDEEPRLLFSSPQQARGESATALQPLQTALSAEQFMELVSAFEAAIDNKVFHRELCNNCSGTILTEENGQQRRYILSALSPDRPVLEAALLACLR